MLELNVKTTVLVAIDPQEGILPFVGGPRTAHDMITHAAQLAKKFRAHGSPTVVICVGQSDDCTEAPEQPVGTQTPAKVLPENQWHYLATLRKCAGDIEVTKRQWEAFYDIDLELQLRHRGIDTIVLCGISTNIDVGSAARNAWEPGFGFIIAENTCSAASTKQHQASMTHTLPRITHVRSVEEILQVL